EIIKGLRERNVTVIYISHRLDEIFELGDYVTVMRDGRHIDTKPISEVKDRSELIKMMIGKTVFEQYTPRERDCDDVILQVSHLSNHKLQDISFTVPRGEIAGFYGLIGAGKTELARAIYGADPYTGDITFKGKKLHPSPAGVIEAGIALVPEERRSQGLFTLLTIRGNVPVMNMKKISRAGFVNGAQEREVTLEYIDKLRIATSSIEKEAAQLSGGNQQKVVLSKCLFADADLLMLDEPTRGIDVGAKSEIYSIIRQLAAEGKSILIFSSELPEVVNICDTIYLLYDGRMQETIRNGCDIDSEMIMHAVSGVTAESGVTPEKGDA
ncbi:MAG: sugar ABC transporter ATP-binding protein, partial [Chloroflexi bacterium]|nr:sugar ABC transporter ATP-binding protein [Chloroflexota bacterium]